MTETYFRKPTFVNKRRFAAVLVMVLLSGLLFTFSTQQEAKPAYAASDVFVMGGPKVSAAQMAAYYRYRQTKDFPSRPFRATVTIEQLAQIYIEEGIAEGVRGDIAFAQGIKETLWFNYPSYGQVRPTDNNFAGVGACNSCASGWVSPDARLGVRQHIQLLRNYADGTSRASNLANPPVAIGRRDVAGNLTYTPWNFDTLLYKGAAPTWGGLNGKWAVPGVGYGESILDIYNSMATWAGVKPSCLPDAQSKSEQISGKGYWTVAPDGSVYSFGVPYYGGMNGKNLNGSILGMASTVSGGGYWLVGSDGGIFSFGDAQFYGSTGAIRLNKPIVGMAPTPSGRGYWLVASDGGIFSFGDAQFYGSTGAIRLNQPIVAMAARPQGDGYWLVASDGGIFTFGNAQFFGSLADCVGRRATMIQSSPSGNGYLVSTTDGRVATAGDAKHFGYSSGVMASMATVR